MVSIPYFKRPATSPVCSHGVRAYARRVRSLAASTAAVNLLTLPRRSIVICPTVPDRRPPSSSPNMRAGLQTNSVECRLGTVGTRPHPTANVRTGCTRVAWKCPARMSASFTRSLSRNRYAAFVLAQSWQTSGIASPGLDDNCSSSARNRLPSRSSANVAPANSRSTQFSPLFASATVRLRRARTGFSGMQHRVEVAHGGVVSHDIESNSRTACKSLTRKRACGQLKGCLIAYNAGISAAGTSAHRCADRSPVASEPVAGFEDYQHPSPAGVRFGRTRIRWQRLVSAPRFLRLIARIRPWGWTNYRAVIVAS